MKDDMVLLNPNLEVNKHSEFENHKSTQSIPYSIRLTRWA